ncbi:MAG: hypothetical protein V1837_06915 [Candidatus Woesearchaeota archaeon]
MKKVLLFLAVLLLAGTFVVGKNQGFSALYSLKTGQNLCKGAGTGIGMPNENVCTNMGIGLISYYMVSEDGFRMGETSNAKANLYASKLKPLTEYQIKLDTNYSVFEVDALANSCQFPNGGAVWQCGYWPYPKLGGSKGFVVLGTVTTDKWGNLKFYRSQTLALPPGFYRNISVIVTQNSAPWTNAALSFDQINFIVTGKT